MLDFALALVRVLIEIPCMASMSREARDELLRIDIGHVEERYRNLSEAEQAWIHDCWQSFQDIVTRQNEVHTSAMRLVSELMRRIGRELESRVDHEEDALQRDEYERLREELVALSWQIPLDSLVDLVEYARKLAGLEVA